MAIREDQVTAAVRFLSNERVAQSTEAEKQQFLSQKGLTGQEIAEAVRRASAVGGGAQAGASQYAPAQPSYAPQPGPYPALPPPPHMWPMPMPQPMPHRPAPSTPWWIILLGGLGMGSVLAFLFNLFMKLKSQQQLMLPSSPAVPAQAPSNSPALSKPGEPGASGDQEEASNRPALAKLEEMASHMKKHVEETREATASLRRTMEQQQRQYQSAMSDFQRKIEELQKKKNNPPAQRIEIGSSSLKALKSLASSSSVQRHSASPAPAAAGASIGGPVKEWLDKVDSQLRRLLRTAGSSKEARRVLQTVSMVVHNLVSHPTEDKYREVNVASARFRETFGEGEAGSAAVELLQMAGFQRSGEAFVFPAGQKFEDAERVRDSMQDALRECDQRWEEARAEVPAAIEPSSNNGSMEPVKSGGAQTQPAAMPWLSSAVQKSLRSQPGNRSASPEAGGGQEDTRGVA